MCEMLKSVTFAELDRKIIESKSNDEDSCLWYPRDYIRNTTFNMIYFAIYGKRLEMNDKIYKTYVENTDATFNYMFYAIFMKLLPKWIGKPLVGKGAELFEQGIKSSYQQTSDDFSNWKENGGKDINTTLVECIIEDYNKNGIKMTDDVKEKLIGDLFTLVGAGMDTTSHTTEVGIILLAKYPQIQEQVYQVKQYIIYNMQTTCLL